MQLLGRTLRLLQKGQIGEKCLALTTLTRHYSAAISMSYEKYESSNTDTNLPPLIIMHGLFGSKQNWRGISKALVSKQNRCVYAVDARNHGDSPHTNEHNSQNMSADVAAFMTAHSLQKACIMGHSMGGRSMMHFAAEHPQMAERLIVVDISPISIPRSFEEMNRIFAALESLNVPSELPMSEGRKLAREQLKSATDSNETVDFIMLNLRKNANTGEFHWAINVPTLHKSLASFHHFEENLQRFPPCNQPTAFICGTHSPFMQPDHWPQVQKYFTNASLHWLDSGHLVHFEQPHQFIQIVVDFLK